MKQLSFEEQYFHHLPSHQHPTHYTTPFHISLTGTETNGYYSSNNLFKILIKTQIFIFSSQTKL